MKLNELIDALKHLQYINIANGELDVWVGGAGGLRNVVGVKRVVSPHPEDNGKLFISIEKEKICR